MHDLLRSDERPTTLLVTHQPAALRAADQVLVLEKGRLARRTMPQELRLATAVESAPSAR